MPIHKNSQPTSQSAIHTPAKAKMRTRNATSVSLPIPYSIVKDRNRLGCRIFIPQLRPSSLAAEPFRIKSEPPLVERRSI